MKTLEILLVQNSAGTDAGENIARIRRLLPGSPSEDLIALPEVFAMRGGHDDYVARAEPIPEPMQAAGTSVVTGTCSLPSLIVTLAPSAGTLTCW